MKKGQYIKTFLFDFAQYHVSGKNGNKVLLKINYKNNTFMIESTNTKISKNFLVEVQSIAERLLQRKHGVNRAAYVRK